jgi:hypothetical protein
MAIVHNTIEAQLEKDLDQFIKKMHPKGLFLWVAAQNEKEEKEILKKIET